MQDAFVVVVALCACPLAVVLRFASQHMHGKPVVHKSLSLAVMLASGFAAGLLHQDDPQNLLAMALAMGMALLAIEAAAFTLVSLPWLWKASQRWSEEERKNPTKLFDF